MSRSEFDGEAYGISSTQVELGKTGIRVSRFCLGTLPMGPLQANLSPREGGDLVLRALDHGVNFVDSAELYGTYGHIKQAVRSLRRRGRVAESALVAAAKSYAYTWEGMEESLHGALRETGLEQIGIFLLHEQESEHTLRGHRAALERLLKAKEEELIRAVGVSTHSPDCVRSCAAMPEVDVVHPLINLRGLGILAAEGSVGKDAASDMLSAVRDAFEAGKGIYSMKALGGGNLFKEVDSALAFARSIPHVHSVAVGVTNEDELLMDIAIVEGLPVPEILRARVQARSRVKRLVIEPWCSGCGECVKSCPSKALSMEGGKPVADRSRCTLCGYCSARCRDFFIKVV